MKRLITFFFLLVQVGCATQYIVPTNRFMTPESQGGAFNSQIEFQQTSGNQLTADLSNASVKDGVTDTLISRSGFFFATSFFDSFDLYWSHTGSSVSLFGAKFQFLGGSKTSKSNGHKMAFTAAVGGNKHQIDGNPSVSFEMQATEYQLLYGYRFSELILLYSNLSYARYLFNGSISSSDPTINGLKPSYDTKSYAFYEGLEFDLWSFFLKVEVGYQQLQTSYTKDLSQFIYGYSVGMTW